MAILTGYKLRLTTGADHTYVRSDDGYVWGCWDGSDGGQPICLGEGSSAQADCISQPNSHAGLIYGVTGVCHQTANRILYPARVTVSQAEGYGASCIAYGTFGKDAYVFFAGRLPQCQVMRSDRAVQPSESVSDLEKKVIKQDEKEAAYVRKVLALYEPGVLGKATLTEAIPHLLNRELELTAEYKFDGNLPGNKVNSMQSAQRDFLKEKEQINQALYAHQVSHEQFVEKVNGLVREFLRQCEQILTKEEFKVMFNMEVGTRFNLVDPEIAAEVLKW
ncbi:MAG: hypothetical protein U1F76_13595 [Candidatus Competibacteraceae bacterium]